MYVCVSKCVCVWFCLCVRIRVCRHVCLCMCCVCVHVCICMHICVRVYTCVHTRKHLLLHGYVGVHAPILLYIFSCYPIWCVTMRWPVTQLRLPPATCQGYFSSLHVPLRLVGANFVPSPFFLFFSLDHFTEDSPGAKPGWFVFFQLYEFYRPCVTAVLLGAEKIGRITPVIYTVLPAYVHRCTYWCRVIGRNMPVIYSFAGLCTPLYLLVPSYRP